MNRIRLVAVAMAALALSPAARADDCADMTKYAKDVYTEFKEIGRKYGCISPVSISGRFRACFLGPQVVTGVTSGMLGWWNKMAKNDWATIGPRTLGTDPEQGNLVLGGRRTFLTSFPVNSSEMTLEIHKLDGRAETEVTICKLEEDGSTKKLVGYTFPNGKDLSTKEWKLQDVEGALISVRLNNKSATNEFQYRIHATATPRKNDLGPVKGLADLHTHQTAQMAFGGDWMWGEMTGTLAVCDGKHASKLFLPGSAEIRHGRPSIEWPHFIDTAHQQVHRDALKKAHENGLNLVVTTPVNNEWLCNALKSIYPNKNVCDDMVSAHQQVDALHRFLEANSDWVELAMDPWHARQIIHDGKLAMVLSLEVSNLFPGGQGDWSAQLDELYFKGLRSLSPVHETDSDFAGAAHQKGLIFRILGVTKYPLSGGIENLFSGKSPRGLTDKGKSLVGELVKRHMLIDVCHMSEKAVADIYDEVRTKHDWYPLYTSHTRFQQTLAREQIESQGEFLTTPQQAEWIRKTGGMAGMRTGPEGSTPYRDDNGAIVFPDSCPGSATTLAQSVLYGRRSAKLNLAFGTDINGFVPMTGPRWGNDRCPAAKKRDSLPEPGAGAGSRTYQLKGVASIEQLPDLYADLQSLGIAEAANLDSAAENYIRMWERAWSSNRGPLP